MSILSTIQYYYFRQFKNLVHANRYFATECQEKVLTQLINTAKHTAFGKEHAFDKIKTYDDFKMNVPLREYEAFKPYIQRIFSREKNVLWPGLPAYFGKSTGTTDASKYLPVTDEFLSCTRYAAKYMLCNLVMQQKHAGFIGKRVLYLDDQQPFENIHGYKCAAISTIKSSGMPGWFKAFSFPGSMPGHINNAEEKLNVIIDNIEGNNIRTAVALPVWLVHFLKAFEKRKGRKFKEVFPLFKIVFLSGMNYEPYEQLIREHMGEAVMIMENYTATEGNFGYAINPGTKGMELICNQGIFYEFIPLEEADKTSPKRLSLKEVKPHQKYALAISTNSGLWAYKMNDIVEFVSTDPYHIVVCGRLNNIFSPFGEHMLPIQAEQAVAAATAAANCIISDFMIVPDFSATRYRCYFAFEHPPAAANIFQMQLEKNLCSFNSYYADLVRSQIIDTPEIIAVAKNFFARLRTVRTNKLSAQTKALHLTMDETVMADAYLIHYSNKI